MIYELCYSCRGGKVEVFPIDKPWDTHEEECPECCGVAVLPLLCVVCLDLPAAVKTPHGLLCHRCFAEDYPDEYRASSNLLRQTGNHAGPHRPTEPGYVPPWPAVGPT